MSKTKLTGIMINIEKKKNVVYIHANGLLKEEDYDFMLPLLKEQMDEFGTINIYFEMKQFQGWTVHAFWKDLKFDINYKDRVKKLALVGDKKWQKIMAEAINPLIKTKVSYYDPEDAYQAKLWLESDQL